MGTHFAKTVFSIAEREDLCVTRKRNQRRSATVAVAVLGIGGLGYNLIEILWRGRTHWSMTVAGGICLYLLYTIYGWMGRGRAAVKCLTSALVITAVEFLVGCAVNLWMKLNVWDYSAEPWNVHGQICLTYSFFWLLLGIPCDFLCRKIKKILA